MPGVGGCSSPTARLLHWPSDAPHDTACPLSLEGQALGHPTAVLLANPAELGWSGCWCCLLPCDLLALLGIQQAGFGLLSLELCCQQLCSSEYSFASGPAVASQELQGVLSCSSVGQGTVASGGAGGAGRLAPCSSETCLLCCCSALQAEREHPCRGAAQSQGWPVSQTKGQFSGQP